MTTDRRKAVPRALEDMRVIDLGTFIAAPFCGTLLAEFDAEVVKVEQPGDCRYGPSVNTRELVVQEGGFLYDSDAYNDDLPYYVRVDGKQYLAVLYNLDVNDMRFGLGPAFVTGSQFELHCRETLDWLYEEEIQTPRMMSVGLHPRIIDRPGRIGALDRFLRYATSVRGVCRATRMEIAQTWIEQFPVDGVVLASPAPGGPS